MFYTYSQNNSGGSFDYDPYAGISHYVIIEADTAERADARALEIGLYFDGVENDYDCDCCGDRWYPQTWYSSDAEGTEAPSVYGRRVDEVTKGDLGMKWIDGFEIFVHYADGTFKGFVDNK